MVLKEKTTTTWYMKVWHYHNVMLNCNSTIVFFKQTMTY